MTNNLNVTSKKYTFFWKKKSPFSQQHPSRFEVDGLEFNCAEQYMMYQKALLFDDEDCAERILEADKPKEQKTIGREIKGFNKEVWDRQKERIVQEGNYAKFTQSGDLYGELIGTAGTDLVEASPSDPVWGVGLRAEDPKILDEKNWKGQNLLGKILTNLRQEIALEHFEDANYNVCMYCAHIVSANARDDYAEGCGMEKVNNGSKMVYPRLTYQTDKAIKRVGKEGLLINWNRGCESFESSGLPAHPKAYDKLVKRNPKTLEVSVDESAIETSWDLISKRDKILGLRNCKSWENIA